MFTLARESCIGLSLPYHGLLQDPWQSGSGPNSTFAGAAGLLQLRLLQAYLLLPKAGAFAPEHASLLRLCASALKGTSAPSGHKNLAGGQHMLVHDPAATVLCCTVQYMAQLLKCLLHVAVIVRFFKNMQYTSQQAPTSWYAIIMHL